MNCAWMLLKGNPQMRDAKGQSIDHPVAEKYANLAHLIDPYSQLDPEEGVGNVLESLQQNQSREKQGPRRGPKGLPIPTVSATKDPDGVGRRDMNRMASEMTSHTLDYGQQDETPSPQYEVERMPRGDDA